MVQLIFQIPRKPPHTDRFSVNSVHGYVFLHDTDYYFLWLWHEIYENVTKWCLNQSRILKNHRQSRFKNLWYQFFLPYDFCPEINNFKCFKVYEGHPRGFRSFSGWFLAILSEPIPKRPKNGRFSENEKVWFFQFFCSEMGWMAWPGHLWIILDSLGHSGPEFSDRQCIL